MKSTIIRRQDIHHDRYCGTLVKVIAISYVSQQ